jgi:Annexin
MKTNPVPEYRDYQIPNAHKPYDNVPQPMATYQNQAYQAKKGASIKEILAYGIVTTIVVGTGIYFFRKAIKERKEKKSDLKSFEDGSPATIAKQIKMAFENDGYWGTDLEKLRYIMGTLKSKEQWQQVLVEYQNQFQSKLLQDMKSELKSSEYDEMLFIKDSKPEKIGQPITKALIYLNWAKRLKSAFDKTYGFLPGTDEVAIRTVLMEIRTQTDFVEVGRAYQREYQRDFIKDLKSELEVWEYPEFMKIILKKPKA